MNAQKQLDTLKHQLMEAWAQKAQLMDKIQSLAIAIQGAELGAAVEKEAAMIGKTNTDQHAFPYDANGSPVNE